ncbi:class I SAM-dependent methyltransferase [Ideonella paludis]|uniref:Class I SAM-dependent methyltransferase n=1 Tax=Ideonella paludis TaxID=1233411 RepID=A0ABS5DY17_9BURK|nr:class I SAM-dependent methyltransferase [Ideonella paludis]MBQ0936042.1 class I SAM-dependent methyltransferase [Ideonella paludis]
MTDLQALDALFADRQDTWWDGFYAQRAKPVPFFVDAPDESLVEWVTGSPSMPGRALDLGCGNCRNSVFLARAGFTVEALDFSATAIDWAQQNVAKAGVSVHLSQASVFEWPGPAQPVDLICDSGLFHHLPPHRRAGYVERVASWLKPGGTLAMTCFKPEGGSGLSDEDVYARQSLGGGLGYTEAQLRSIWGEAFDIQVLRPMQAYAKEAAVFGLPFLWAMRARRSVP